MNIVTAAFKSTFFLSVLCFLVLFPSTNNAQVSVTQQEFLSVFTPGSQHYYSPMASGSINIGKTGGRMFMIFHLLILILCKYQITI